MENNVFRDIDSVKEFTKQMIYQSLDYKTDKIPIYPRIFKDFPNPQRFDFSLKLGIAFSVIRLEAQRANANIDIVNVGMREAVEDIHDDLKSRYLKLE